MQLYFPMAQADRTVYPQSGPGPILPDNRPQWSQVTQGRRHRHQRMAHTTDRQLS